MHSNPGAPSPQDTLGVKGKFLLSINGHPQMREALKASTSAPPSLTYTVSNGHACSGRQLLIRDL